MQERHVNRSKYFKEQEFTSGKYILPFIRDVKEIHRDTSILEIRCGEGGNLVPFLKIGCQKIVGIDLSKGKIENAYRYFNELKSDHTIELICNDLFNVSAENIGQFDITIARDVLEHIQGHDKFLKLVKTFMKVDGKFFLGFPPLQNPFGGHQQMCESKFLSKLPYFHILPYSAYKFILKLFGETEAKNEGLLKTKETGITIEGFERILRMNNYTMDKRIFYFINPNYEVKFGLKPRISWKLISSIPLLRIFLLPPTTI